MLIPEDLYNGSPGFCALSIREETPSTLPVSRPMDSLSQLTRKQCVMVAPGYRLILLLLTTGGPALPGYPFYLVIPYQSCGETPLSYAHPPHDSGPDLSVPADTQRLRENDVGKDEGSLGVPNPSKDPPPFHSQDCREVAP